MTMIMAHDDNDGNHCSNILNEVFSNANVLNRNIKNEIIEEIKNSEDYLIILADIPICENVIDEINRKLSIDGNVRFIIFDHHYSHPKMKSSDRVDFYWRDPNTGDASSLVEKWILCGDPNRRVVGIEDYLV